uniref:Uncharacterized protein n=1 Tax=Arundo donax TaxID=35708 RepID=A0A0A9CZA0_ARUDO
MHVVLLPFPAQGHFAAFLSLGGRHSCLHPAQRGRAPRQLLGGGCAVPPVPRAALRARGARPARGSRVRRRRPRPPLPRALRGHRVALDPRRLRRLPGRRLRRRGRCRGCRCRRRRPLPGLDHWRRAPARRQARILRVLRRVRQRGVPLALEPPAAPARAGRRRVLPAGSPGGHRLPLAAPEAPPRRRRHRLVVGLPSPADIARL